MNEFIFHAIRRWVIWEYGFEIPEARTLSEKVVTYLKTLYGHSIKGTKRNPRGTAGKPSDVRTSNTSTHVKALAIHQPSTHRRAATHDLYSTVAQQLALHWILHFTHSAYLCFVQSSKQRVINFPNSTNQLSLYGKGLGSSVSLNLNL